jgi:hypothetical protein
MAIIMRGNIAEPSGPRTIFPEPSNTFGLVLDFGEAMDTLHIVKRSKGVRDRNSDHYPSPRVAFVASQPKVERHSNIPKPPPMASDRRKRAARYVKTSTHEPADRDKLESNLD